MEEVGEGAERPTCSRRGLQDVRAAREEANDNVKFLKPLRRHLEKLSLMDDFPALVRLGGLAAPHCGAGQGEMHGGPLS